jgi:hypothetical protein
MGRYRQEQARVMELLHGYSGLGQRMITERFGGLAVADCLLSRRSPKTDTVFSS